MDQRNLSEIPLALVGMACRLPGAANLEEYWRLIESGSDATGELPASILDRELYYDPRRGIRGKSYTATGGMCSKTPHDPSKCRFPTEVLATYDEAHVTMCEVAHDALQDATYDPFHLRTRNVGVFFGHTCGSRIAGDLVYSVYAEQTAQYLHEVQAAQGLSRAERSAIIRTLVADARAKYDHRRRTPSLDLCANRGTQLIVHAFGLDGPGVVVDAACASSVFAMLLGIRALQLGSIDMALVGGASYLKSDSLVLFSAAQSVSAGKSCPFDEDAGGLVTSEGYVALVLKTLPRAIADGDQIRAVIRSIGVSADGRGKSLWAPLKTGQILAMKRAYQGAVRPQDLQYIEAHATSTQVGDATELTALAEAFPKEMFAGRRIPLGSVKGNIGHTLETAGMASLAKVVLAMEHGVIPPVANLTNPNSAVSWESLPFYLPRTAEAWPQPAGGTRKAAVNTFGIGGLNAHIVVEEYDGGKPASYYHVPHTEGSPSSHSNEPIAVIGSGVIMPGARTLDAFWNLLQSGIDPKTDVTPERWNADIYYDPRGEHAYRTRSKRGGFLTDYQYDWRRHRVPPKQVEKANPLQFMLLDATEQALQQAGYSKKSFDRDRVGVVVGTVFGGDFSNDLQMGLRLPEFQRDLARLLRDRKVPADQIESVLAQFADRLLKRMPALLDETGSFTSSTLASRITKTFDLRGGAFSLDGGISSGLAALDACANMLRGGDCDIMICAAGQRNMDIVAFENLDRFGALAIGDPAPAYDARSCGYLPGEGCAVLLLKRLSDARRDGDQVLAVVRSVSASANFQASGGSLQTCLRRAIQEANIAPEEVRAVEAIGTTPRLAEMEVKAARDVLAASDRREPVTISSLASQFGYTGAVHPLAGVVEASLGIAAASLPAGIPTEHPDTQLFGCGQVAPQQGPLPLTPADGAAVAVLCGSEHGISYAAVLEPATKPAKSSHVAPVAVPESVSPRIVRLGAAHMTELLETLRTQSAERLYEEIAAFNEGNRVRLAIVATDFSDFRNRLQTAKEQLVARTAETRRRLAGEGVFFGEVNPERRGVAFVFPGQGSQYAGMFSELTAALPPAQHAKRVADAAMRALGYPSFQEIAGKDAVGLGTDVWRTQVGLLLAEFIADHTLQALGLSPIVVTGHSFGEYTALISAGAWSLTDAIRCTFHRSQAITKTPGLEGCMAVTDAKPLLLEQVLASVGNNVTPANFNAPQQTVIAGRHDAVEQAVKELRAAGCSAMVIKVPCPFHSPMMRPAAEKLAQYVPEIPLRKAWIPIIGTASARPITEPDEVASDLIEQLVSPVKYMDMLAQILAYRPALVVEVGPQQILTKLNYQIHPEDDVVFIGADNRRLRDVRSFWGVVAQAECLGCQPHEAVASPQPSHPKSEPRLVVFDASKGRRERMRERSEGQVALDPERRSGNQPSVARAKPSRLVESPSPIAIPFHVAAPLPVPTASVAPPSPPAPIAKTPVISPARPSVDAAELRKTLVEFVIEQTGYPEEIVEMDADLEADLGIDSIKKAQLFGEVGARFQIAPRADLSLDDFPTLGHVLRFLVAELDARTASTETVALQLVSVSAEAPIAKPNGKLQPAKPSVDAAELRKTLVEFVIEQTGYPEEIVEMDADLEADLGIDSIKKAQLFGEVGVRFQIAPRADLSLDDFPTLGHVLRFLVAELDARTASTETVALQVVSVSAEAPIAKPNGKLQPAKPSVDAAELRKTLIDFVIEQTGYPEEIVEMDADLEADLGIDSIKKAQLFGEVGARFQIAPRADLSLDDFPTLGHVLRFLVAELDARTASTETVALQLVSVSAEAPIAKPNGKLQPAKPSVDAAELRKTLVEFVIEQTGYPEEIVEMDADLEADLGIDSIKKAQLFGEVGVRFQIAPRADLSLDDFPTLGHVLRFLVAELDARAPSHGTDHRRDEVAETAAIPTNVAEKRPSQARPTNDDFVRLVRLAGSASQRGLQHGQAMADEVRKALTILADAPQGTNGHGAVSWSDPSLDELRGIAAGADVNLEAVSAWNCRLDPLAIWPAVLGKESVSPEPVFESPIGVFVSDDGQLPYVSIGRPGQIVPRAAVNAAGVVVSCDFLAGDVSPTEISTFASTIPEVLATCRTRDAAFQRLQLQTLFCRGPWCVGVSVVGQSDAVYLRAKAEGIRAVGVDEVGSQQRSFHESLRQGESLLVANRRTGVVRRFHLGELLGISSFAETMQPEPQPASNNLMQRHVLRMAAAAGEQTGTSPYRADDALCVIGCPPLGRVLREAWEQIGCRVTLLSDKGLTAEFGAILAQQPPQHLVFLEEETPVPLDRFAASAYFAPRFEALRVWVHALEERGGLSRASLTAVTRMGGDFGFHSNVECFTGGGWTGLLKAVRREFPSLRTKVVDVARQSRPDEAARCIQAEWLNDSSDIEVGYRNGVRFVVAAIGQPAPAATSQIRRGGVWVVTGGGRGVTAVVARQLGAQFKLRLHMLGTAPIPEDRAPWLHATESELKDMKKEIALQSRREGKSPVDQWREVEKARELVANLQKFADADVAAAYHRCDIADCDALERTLAEIRCADGPIEGVIHGAGVEASCRFSRKLASSVQRCIAAKCDGAANLIALTRHDPLRHFVAFGSTSGRFGGLGQADYSLASDLLAKMTARLTVERPECHCMCFHWPAWGDVGMAVRPESKVVLEQANLAFMPSLEGAGHLLRELLAGAPEHEVLVLDKPEPLDTDGTMSRRSALADPSLFRESAAAVAAAPAPSLADAAIRSDCSRSALIDSFGPDAEPGRYVATMTLDPLQDPFLIHHRFKGKPFLPGVITIESFAEAIALVEPSRPIVAFSEVLLGSGLSLDTRKYDVRILIERHPKGYRCQLVGPFINTQGQMGGDRVYASGIVELGDEPPQIDRIVTGEPPVGWTPFVYPKDSQIVHGAPLQACKALAFQHDGGLAKIAGTSPRELFGPRRSGDVKIACAAVDAGFVACSVYSYCMLERCREVPGGVTRFRQTRLPAVGENCILRFFYRGVNKDGNLYDFTVMGADGDAILEVIGYQTTRVDWSA